jgi:hypothetical protein
MPDLVTIPDVELVRVGVHEISNGTWHVERADLADAVAASRAGVIRDPVIKLGHEGPMRDGAPALGRVRNLRVTNGGDVLVGDFVDVPRAVAAMMPKAWPQRSVEGLVDWDFGGRTWRLVITACALLGATMPGVQGLADIADLEDVAALYGVAAKRVAIAARTFTPTADESRLRAVQVAAARRRRTNHTIGV